MTANCHRCGVSAAFFPLDENGYCEECKNYSTAPLTPEVGRVCACGVALPKHRNKGYRLKCDDCNDYARKKKHPPRPCKRESCDVVFVPQHGLQKYCNFDCRDLAQLERMANRDGWIFVETRSCAECGEQVPRPRRKYCSDVCEDIGFRRYRRELYHRRKNRNKVTE